MHWNYAFCVPAFDKWIFGILIALLLNETTKLNSCFHLASLF